MNPLPSLALVSSPASVLSRWPDPQSMLAPYECEKADRLRSAPARASYLAAHLLLREAASIVTGLPMRALVLQQRCPDCGGPHGRPSFAGMQSLKVSMSHGDKTVAAVAGWSPVAIDVEDCGTRDRGDLLQAPVFSAQERHSLAGLGDPSRIESEMLRLWVRKECLIKLGRLSLDSMGDCDLSQSGDSFEGWRFSDWHDTARGAIGAVASCGPVELRLLDDPRAETAVQEMRRGVNDISRPARHNSSHAQERDAMPMTARQQARASA